MATSPPKSKTSISANERWVEHDCQGDRKSMYSKSHRLITYSSILQTAKPEKYFRNKVWGISSVLCKCAWEGKSYR